MDPNAPVVPPPVVARHRTFALGWVKLNLTPRPESDAISPAACDLRVLGLVLVEAPAQEAR